MIFRNNWGIEDFDKRVGGLPQCALSVVETPDNRTGMMMLGQFLHEGLRQDEKCVLITFESPVAFLENFSESRHNFHPFLEKEQFIYLQYKPSIMGEIGLSYRYGLLFDEIVHLARNVPHRIAIHQIDSLFSLHNAALINSCAQKLVSASQKINSTILGQFVQFNDDTHLQLSVACKKAMTGSFALEREPGIHQYSLATHRVPWFHYDQKPVHLRLQEGEGFVGIGSSHDVAKVG